MTASRRRFLRLCGVAGAGALAGCIDGLATDGTPASGDASERWTQQTVFTADDVFGGDGIGTSVAVSNDGTAALVGAPLDSGLHRQRSETTDVPGGVGAAYVFEAGDESWCRQIKLTAENGESGDRFGVSTAVSSDGTTALVGAEKFDDPNGVEAGEAYVFDASGGSWSQQARLTPDDHERGDNFGRAAAVSGDGTTALIGAYRDDDSEPGSAYVFDGSGGSWSQQARLTADDRDGGDDFGRSVAVSSDGTTAFVGAPLDEDPNGSLAGSAYVFDATDGSWSQRAKLTPDDGDSEDTFGWSVAVSGDGATALVGAQTDEDPNGPQAGSAYVFEAGDESWNQQAKLVAEDGEKGDLFGRAVALSSDGTTALIGAEKEGVMKSGAAYVFGVSDGSWSQQSKLTPDDRDGTTQFGSSVAASRAGTAALIGDPVYKNDPSGSAYVFTR